MFQLDLIEPAFKSYYLLPCSFFFFHLYLEVIFNWTSHPCPECCRCCFFVLKSANLLKWISHFSSQSLCGIFLRISFKKRVISSLLYSTDWRLGPVTSSSLFQTLMLSALSYPAGLYHVVYHLKSMYSCTLRSSAIRQDYPWFIEVVTSLRRCWHILLFVLHHFLSRPQRCLPETMLSSLLSAHSAVTDWCTWVNR